MNAIYVKDLVKRYKNGVQALDGLTLTVKEGEIFSLLGPNGAGKSTLIHVLTTYLRPTSGFVTMFGKDISREAAEIRSKISCVAQRTSIDTYLSLTENMTFQSKLYQVPRAEAAKRMEMLISCFGLEDYLKYPVSCYSGGVKRRLDIALSLISNPKVLFLDEPTVGMDIGSRRAMWDMVKKIRTDFGTTIFLTTHYLEEADELSDTICIMKNGKEVIQDSPNALREYLRQDTLKGIIASKEPTLEDVFISLTGEKEKEVR
ncbi:MAG: ATP-binding cassette domain-containing protein [Lachnospiraceae bacterium]